MRSYSPVRTHVGALPALGLVLAIHTGAGAQVGHNQRRHRHREPVHRFPPSGEEVGGVRLKVQNDVADISLRADARAANRASFSPRDLLSAPR